MDATPNNELEIDKRTARLRRQNVARVARHRFRRRNDTRCLRIEIANWTAMIEGFVEAGVLAQAKRDDPAAIEAAIARLCREGYRSAMSAQANVRPIVADDAVRPNRQIAGATNRGRGTPLATPAPNKEGVRDLCRLK